MSRLWVLAQAEDAVVDWMVYPLVAKRRAIARATGLDVRQVVVRDFAATAAALRQAAPDDVVLANSSWRVPADETMAFFAEQAQRPGRPRIVYLDTFDQTSSPFFGVLPHVDAYAKKQLLAQRADYRARYAGGFVVSDFLARHAGLDLDGWHFGSEVPAELEHKLVLAWNLGSARHLRRGFQRRVLPQDRRTIDLHCRVSYGEEDSWYEAHRKAVVAALEPLARHHAVVAAGGKAARVPLAVFQDEMRRARIGFSPFGWGEVTDRDFHIINAGALLMKPDMGHLVTEPDIYRPGETYVPVRWDLADVGEKVAHYANHPAQAQAIVDRARQVARGYFARRGGFLPAVQRVVAAARPAAVPAG